MACDPLPTFADLVAEHGPFTSASIRVGETWTMGAGLAGAAERNLRRTLQVVADAAGGSLEGLRILELASLEGLYGVEAALQGATVVGVEARPGHLAKARWLAGELGVADRAEFVQGDVRSLAELDLGTFDVVLCMGILYHLEAPDALGLLRGVAACTRRFALVEGQVSLSGRSTAQVDGLTVRGAELPEPPAPWSAVGNPTSFWLTRPSLLNALQAAGFTSVLETAVPFVAELAAYRDHVQLLAFRGTPMQPRLTPQLAGDPPAWPERLTRVAHPDQGRVHRLRDRLLGRGLGDVFGKR